MKNKEIEELLNKMKNCNGVFDYYLEYGEVDLLLSYIEQLENNKEKEYVLVGRMQLKTRDYIHQLEKEKRQLKNNRDKAIEYIANIICDEKARVRHDLCGKDIDGLINILKGDSDV